MPSDCRILGIAETQDIEIIKGAFRKRAKELHPDLAKDGDQLERHLLFAEVCKAYKRLLGRKQGQVDEDRSERNSRVDNGAIAKHSDPAYVYYRTGIRYFMMIHPSHWNLDNRMLNTKIAGNNEEQEIIKQKIMELVKLFPKAYYYFSMVVHEYPGSDWEYDAKEKMKLIEERMAMYKRIIESFYSWNVDNKEIIRQYLELYQNHDKTKKSLTGNERRKWEE
jgi:hypothetical protein